jgi:hypothetical protein
MKKNVLALEKKIIKIEAIEKSRLNKLMKERGMIDTNRKSNSSHSSKGPHNNKVKFQKSVLLSPSYSSSVSMSEFTPLANIKYEKYASCESQLFRVIREIPSDVLRNMVQQRSDFQKKEQELQEKF